MNKENYRSQVNTETRTIALRVARRCALIAAIFTLTVIEAPPVAAQAVTKSELRELTAHFPPPEDWKVARNKEGRLIAMPTLQDGNESDAVFGVTDDGKTWQYVEVKGNAKTSYDNRPITRAEAIDIAKRLYGERIWRDAMGRTESDTKIEQRMEWAEWFRQERK